MAVAAPKRRSSAAPAPAPSRTAPPKPKRRKKADDGSPIRVRRTKGAAAPAPARAPARTAPARRKPARKAAPKHRAAQPKLALVVGRTAAGVRGLPDSGLIVRMTRGRAWIAVLGVLLVGIVALNVVTLSFAASSGKIDEQNQALEEENSMLTNRAAAAFSQDRVRHEAADQGLAMSTSEEPHVIQYQHGDIETAAQRLQGAG